MVFHDKSESGRKQNARENVTLKAKLCEIVRGAVTKVNYSKSETFTRAEAIKDYEIRAGLERANATAFLLERRLHIQ